MCDLKWFSDIDVPTFITHGVQDKLPYELIDCILGLCFKRGKTGQANYFQFFDIESVDDGFEITMTQEQPELVTKHKLNINTEKRFTGKVCCTETWNGVSKEKATIDDHYIMILLPEER